MQFYWKRQLIKSSLKSNENFNESRKEGYLDLIKLELRNSTGREFKDVPAVRACGASWYL